MKHFNLLAGMTISALAMSAGMAAGATKTWTGNANDSWTNGANWMPSGEPGTGDDIIIPSISPSPVYTSAASADTFGTVTLEAGAQLDIEAAVTITSTLDMESGSTVNAEASVTTLNATVGEASGSPANLNIVAGSSDPFTVSGKMTVEVTGTVNVGSNATSDVGVLVLTRSEGGMGLEALDIDSGGHIQVEVSMSKLEFDTSSGSLLATIDGTIEFQNSGMLSAMDSVELDGAGSATLGSNATVQIEVAKTLTNNLDLGVIANTGSASIVGQISGFMTPGKFDNQSKVTATGTLSFASSTRLDDNPTPSVSEWIASGSTGKLEFNRSHSAALSLDGDFEVINGGTVTVNSNVTIETDGDLICGSGNPGLVEACGAHFWSGSVDLDDNRYLCGTGLLNDCP